MFDDLRHAQAELDAWVASYNHERPHQAKDMATPANLFHAARGRPADDRALDKIDRSSNDWVTRKVSAVGVITVAHQQISVGKQRAGRIADVHVGPDLLHIWDCKVLLKSALRHEKRR